jgi:hypothetical protein
VSDPKSLELKQALAEFVREHMPWPFYDMSRYDSEGTDAAHDIAERLLPKLQAEFDDIARSAKTSWRSRRSAALAALDAAEREGARGPRADHE